MITEIIPASKTIVSTLSHNSINDISDCAMFPNNVTGEQFLL